MHVLLVYHRGKEAFQHGPALQTIMTQTPKFTSFLEAKVVAMSSKLAVHLMKKTTQKTLLRVCVIGGASTLIAPSHSLDPQFPFLGVPGKMVNITSPDDLTEYIRQLLNDDIISVIVQKTNHNAAEKLRSSCPSQNSHLKKMSAGDKVGNAGVLFTSLLLLQEIVQKPRQDLYWSKNKLLHTPCFREVMSGNRFQLLVKTLHCVNNDSVPNLSGHP